MAPQSKEAYSRRTQVLEDYRVREPDKLIELGTVHETEDRIIAWIGTPATK